MKKIIFLLLMLPLVAACANGMPTRDSFFSSTCVDEGDPPIAMTRFTLTLLTYGDSHIAMLPLSRVHENSEFRIRLKPRSRDNENRDYKTALVSISSDDDDTDPIQNWLDVAGTFNTAKNNVLVVCVPELGLNPGEFRRYKFKVKISDGSGTVYGYLDPRADIVPD